MSEPCRHEREVERQQVRVELARLQRDYETMRRKYVVAERDAAVATIVRLEGEVEAGLQTEKSTNITVRAILAELRANLTERDATIEQVRALLDKWDVDGMPAWPTAEIRAALGPSL